MPAVADARRLVVATDIAILRYRTKERRAIAPDVFAELGEALFWRCALAEVVGANREPVVLGLRWARNRVAHGIVLTAPTAWKYGAEPGRLVLGRAVPGATSGHAWLAREAVPTERTARDRPDQNAAYDAELAGRPVLESLNRARIACGGRMVKG